MWSLKFLEKSVNFTAEKVYEPCCEMREDKTKRCSGKVIPCTPSVLFIIILVNPVRNNGHP